MGGDDADATLGPSLGFLAMAAGVKVFRNFGSLRNPVAEEPQLFLESEEGVELTIVVSSDCS